MLYEDSPEYFANRVIKVENWYGNNIISQVKLSAKFLSTFYRHLDAHSTSLSLSPCFILDILEELKTIYIERARYLPRKSARFPRSLVVRSPTRRGRRYLKCRIQFPAPASPLPLSPTLALSISLSLPSLRWDFLIQFHTSLVLPNLVLCRRRRRCHRPSSTGRGNHPREEVSA